MSRQPAVAMGEVTVHGAPRPLPCPVKHVRARQNVRRGGGFTVEERVYECGNGLALGVRRGGPLHLADKETWEVVVLTPQRVVNGTSATYVTEDQLLDMVHRLSRWRAR